MTAIGFSTLLFWVASWMQGTVGWALLTMPIPLLALLLIPLLTTVATLVLQSATVRLIHPMSISFINRLQWGAGQVAWEPLMHLISHRNWPPNQLQIGPVCHNNLLLFFLLMKVAMVHPANPIPRETHKHKVMAKSHNTSTWMESIKLILCVYINMCVCVCVWVWIGTSKYYTRSLIFPRPSSMVSSVSLENSKLRLRTLGSWSVCWGLSATWVSYCKWSWEGYV